jgi:hypothetical protein
MKVTSSVKSVKLVAIAVLVSSQRNVRQVICAQRPHSMINRTLPDSSVKLASTVQRVRPQRFPVLSKHRVLQ